MTKSRTLRRAGAVVLSLAMAVSPLFIAPNSLAASNPKLSKTSVSVYVGKKKTIKIKLTKAQKKQLKSVSVKMTSAQKKKAKVTASKKTLKVTITGKKKGTVKNAKVVLKFKKKVNKKKTWTLKIKKITIKKKATPTAEPTAVPEDGIVAELTNPINSDYTDVVLQSTTAIIKVTALQGGKPLANTTVVFSGSDDNDGIAFTNDEYEIKGNTTVQTDANGNATFVIGNKKAVKANEAGAWGSFKYEAAVASTGKKVAGTVRFAQFYIDGIDNINDNGSTTDDYADLVPGTNAVGKGYDDALESETMSLDGTTTDYVGSQQASKKTAAGEHKVGFSGGQPMIFAAGVGDDESDAKKATQEINFTSSEYHVYTGNATADTTHVEKIKQDVSGLVQAYVHFDNVSISNHTNFVVETWTDYDNAVANTGAPIDQTVYNGATLKNSSFDYQIPISKGVANSSWAIKTYIQSEGQVDTAKNKGYTLKDITYTFKNKNAKAGVDEALKGTAITWKAVETRFTAEQELTLANVSKDSPFKTNTSALGLETDNAAFATSFTAFANKFAAPSVTKVTYKVPTFPQTGMAIVTTYDKNNQVVGYFAVPTINNGANQNVLDFDITSWTVLGDAAAHNAAEPYKISADEANTDKVGTVSQPSAGVVEVDSDVQGRTTLEGEITGLDIDGLDASTRFVYASVEWNPVEKGDEAVAENDAFLAIVGQSVEVNAQLVDVNGNKVKTDGVPVTFKSAGGDIGNSGSKVKNTNVVDSKASVIEKSAETDKDGKAKLILKSNDITDAVGITATSGDTKYDLVLEIGGQSVAKADLYWLEVNLAFTDEPSGTTYETGTADHNVNVPQTAIDIVSGETWEYGVYATADADMTYGALAGKGSKVAVSDVAIKMEKGVKFDGTLTPVSNGVVTVTATKTGTFQIDSSIDKTSLKDAKFKVDGTDYTFVGTGDPSNNRSLVVNSDVKENGRVAEFVDVAPEETVVADSSKVYRYIKVSDKNGNAVPGATVYATVTDVTNKGTTDPFDPVLGKVLDNGTFTPGSGAKETTTSSAYYGMVEGTTDENGVAAIEITKPAGKASSTITAKVEGIDGGVYTASLNWETSPVGSFAVNAEKKDGKYQVVYTEDTANGIITIPFTEAIYANSVDKSQWGVTYDADGALGSVDPKKYTVKEATVAEGTLTLTLDGKVDSGEGEFTVTYGEKAFGGVKYAFTSRKGNILQDGGYIEFTKDAGTTAPNVTALNSLGSYTGATLPADKPTALSDANDSMGAVDTAFDALDGTTGKWTAYTAAVATAEDDIAIAKEVFGATDDNIAAQTNYGAYAADIATNFDKFVCAIDSIADLDVANATSESDAKAGLATTCSGKNAKGVAVTEITIAAANWITAATYDGAAGGTFTYTNGTLSKTGGYTFQTGVEATQDIVVAGP